LSKLEFTRGEIIASKYEVVDLLDESPLGFTYRAKHQKSGKFVRLTMLRPKLAGREQKDQLLDLYKRVKDFQHPAVIKIGELGDNEGIAYFTAEDFEGQTLREFLTEYKVSGQKLELTEAAQVTVQILEGVDALHKLGFVLRGLRPEHILVNVRRTGPRNKNFVARVKLLGSGFWDLVSAATLAEDEFQRGEAQYLAPEMKSFEPTATVRGDMYSVGVIFYELLTGTAPVGTFQMPASVRPDLPKFVNDIVELALAQSPDDRYQTANDFLAGIQRTINLSELGEETKKPLITPVTGILGVLLLIASIVILWQLRPDPEAEAAKQKLADATLRQQVQSQLDIPGVDEVKAILARQPPAMIYVPGGPYVEGRMNYDPMAQTTESPALVKDTKAFLIDQYEYPNVKGQVPKKDVDYATAKQLCEANGERLCTSAEWEKACKGPLSSIYAYDTESPADVFDPGFCGDGLADRDYPSGARAQCRSGYGVFDMSGNYREWTDTAPPDKDKRRYVKGGKARDSELGTRCAFSTDESTGFQDSSMSFRCCRDVDAPAWTPPAVPPAGTVVPPGTPAPK
jgi:serine/threonine protein kinase